MDKLWSILFGVTILLCGLSFAIAPGAGWWLPADFSTFGHEVDYLFYVIFWITAFFFVLTEAILVWNLFRAAANPDKKSPYVHGNHKLEIIWSAVPFGILLFIAIVQIAPWERIKYGKSMPKPTADAHQIIVVARQWEWRFIYPNPRDVRRWDDEMKKNGTTTGPDNFNRLANYSDDYMQSDAVHGVNELHVYQVKGDAGKVLVHLKTRDVIHSFFLPYLRLKQDALPGKTIPVWFAVNDYNCAEKEPGHWVDGYDPKTNSYATWNDKTSKYEPTNQRIWDLACAEFCGTRHSMMRGRLFVHKDKDDYLKWLDHAWAEQERRGPTEKVENKVAKTQE